MNKRGELTSAQIIKMLILLGGFIIVALFMWGIYEMQEEATGKELCKLSIIERATIPFIGKQIIPSLKCTTEKICITSKRKGACKQFAGEENIRAVKIDLNDVEEARNIIERESANAMFDCWRMTGEGKLDIFDSRDTRFNLAEPKCLVCYRLAIAEDVSQEILKDVDLTKYLAEENVPGSSLTYLQTFTNEGVRSYAGGNEKVDKDNLPVQSNQLAFVFMQIKTEEDAGDVFADTAMIGAGIIVGGGALTGPGRWIAKTAFRASALWTAAIGLVAIGGTATFAAVQTSRSQDVSAAYCGSFETNSENARLGCSVVKRVDWDVNIINQLCKGGIEGNL
tara:strand:+ start:188 stop:1201 length:1014 start_codon:yes stop_codon:yes gene_type:complete